MSAKAQLSTSTHPHLSDTKVINMASGDASVTRVCKGDYGFEDLSNAYDGHMDFFIVKHINGVRGRHRL